VEFGSALQQLPPAHARAVELWSRGASELEIAAALEITTSAVAPLVEVGVAKLAAVLRLAVLTGGTEQP
jgi:hypothetical protein